MIKRRLDELLVERGLADDIKQAQGLIMAGEASVGDHMVDKPGTMLAADAVVKLNTSSRYASRGGDKLASVAGQFSLELEGKVVLDVGSSTGGFTDYGLQHGAVKVYAVDVGNNQLAYKLRQDERVVVMERTDIRAAVLPERPDMAVVDVSFISLTKVLGAVAELIKPQGIIVAMAKPQFEADKSTADRFHGVIEDEAVRQQILGELRAWLAERFEVVAEADSGLPGAKGNVERFFLLTALARR